MKQLLIYSLFLIEMLTTTIGCSNRGTYRLEEALEFAGSNRHELEKVLEHYAGEPMKLEAARFLIENMPGHYSYADTSGINRYYRELDSMLTAMPKGDLQKAREAIDSLGKAYSWIDKALVQDIHIVTAGFLIANIDSAFSKWERTPWGRHLTFEQFCETLLPYKAEELQPLDQWRAYMPDSLPLDTGFLDCDQFEESPLRATMAIHELMKLKLNPAALAFPLPLPVQSLPVRLKIPYGVCEDYAAIATSALRAHGIPVFNDFTPQWGYRNRLGHGWNVLPHCNGQQVPFVGGMIAPGEAHKLDDRIAKAFRHTYARNKDIERLMHTEKFVPENFRNQFICDVTAQYAICSDVELEAGDIPAAHVYLAIFEDAANWVPVAVSQVEGGKARFRDMGRRCVYLPVIYDESGKMRPVADPIAIGIDGWQDFLATSSTGTQTLTLKRKYPALEYVYDVAPRIIGGEFQVSTRKDFADAKTVYTITDGAPTAHEAMLSDSIGAYRYWRYIQNVPGTFCNMAEIEFFRPGESTHIYGEILGTDGYCWIYADRTKEKVFDGDILTTFDAPVDNGAWVGMDFGEPVRISRIVYTGRGDGNSIESGDTYELFYWNGGQWNSCGRKEATGVSITYDNVPTNGLYLLRDLTKGQDERIFTYENGEQVWW